MALQDLYFAGKGRFRQVCSSLGLIDHFDLDLIDVVNNGHVVLFLQILLKIEEAFTAYCSGHLSQGTINIMRRVE